MPCLLKLNALADLPSRGIGSMRREGMPVLQAQAGEGEEGVEEAQAAQAMSMCQLGVPWHASRSSQVRAGNVVYM